MLQDPYQKRPFCAFTVLTISSPRGNPYVRWSCELAARTVLFSEIVQYQRILPVLRSNLHRCSTVPGGLFFIFLRGAEALRHPKARGSGGEFCAGSGESHFSQSTRLMHPHCKNNVKGNGQECAFHTSKVKGSGAWPALYTRQRT
jgi:hypothetical protein